MKPRKNQLNLKATDYIVTAYPERCSGPGWANAPIYVIVQDRTDGSLRREVIQPDQQTPEMLTIFSVCYEAHLALMREIERMGR